MEQLCQPGGDILFQCGDARHDILHGFRCLILVEIAGHGDLVAYLGLAVVDPCVGGVGQNFPGKVGVNILHQRHVFGVTQAGVRHRLAALQDNVACFVPLGALHHDLVVAELHALEHLALAVDAVFVAVHLAVGKLAVGGDDQLPAGIGDVVALGADALAAGLEAVAGVNKLYLARTVGGLILAEHPDVGGDAGVHEHIGGKLDDAVQPVVFQNILPDVAGSAAGIAAEQGRAVLDNGHLALGKQAYEQFKLDEIWFMPSHVPPHKKDHFITDGAARIRMLELATESIPYFTVSDFEMGREGNTYTAQTLALLKEAYPDIEVYFIIGADSLYQLESWYHPEQVMAQAVLLVSGRTYEDGGVPLEDKVAYFNEKYNADIRILHNPKIDVASADIRKKAAEGRDLSKDMPAAVAEYIRETGLYLTK